MTRYRVEYQPVPTLTPDQWAIVADRIHTRATALAIADQWPALRPDLPAVRVRIVPSRKDGTR